MKHALKVSLLLAVVSLAACNGQKTVSNSPSTQPNPNAPALTEGLAASSKGDVVAELNGQPITNQELMGKIKSRLSRVENQIYDIKRDAIDQMIDERLLDAEAKKRNISVAELLKTEVDDKVGEVSDKEIEDLYNQNKARFGEKTLAELKPQIAAQLKSRKAMAYRQTFLDRLSAKADIQIYIERPRAEVGPGNSPSKGPTSAVVTLIEFTDFQCPFCSRARPTVNEIMNLYKNEVRYTMRNFPLDFHNFAKKAAVAALCANDQNKYWDYSNKLWENQRALDTPSLKKYAEELKLDTKKFDECLDSDKYLAQVNKDVEEGMKAGVSGTPSFFVNGKMLSGAQPLEAFKKMIDEEIRDAKRKKS